MKKIKIYSLVLILTIFVFEANANYIDPIKLIRNNYSFFIKTGSKIIFTNNNSDLNQTTKYELNKILQILKTNTELKIEIGVHADTRSLRAEAFVITNKRAVTLKEYLVKYGANSDNIIVMGYGFSKLTNKCKEFVKCSIKEHNANKRVEFKVLNLETLANYKIINNKKQIVTKNN